MQGSEKSDVRLSQEVRWTSEEAQALYNQLQQAIMDHEHDRLHGILAPPAYLRQLMLEAQKETAHLREQAAELYKTYTVPAVVAGLAQR